MHDFEAGEVVIFPPHGVARVERRSTTEPAMKGVDVFVVRIEVPGARLESRGGHLLVKRVPEGQIGYVRVEEAGAKLRRPPSADEAGALLARLRAPGEPLAEGADAVLAAVDRGLRGSREEAIESLRRCRATTAPVSFVEREAMRALERMTMTELAAGLGRDPDALLAESGAAPWRGD